MNHPTNSVILERLDNTLIVLQEFKKETKEHFGVLNGQTSRNTKFRTQVRAGFTVVAASFGGLSVIIGIILGLKKLL